MTKRHTTLQAKLAHESSTSAKKRAKGMGIMEDLLKSAKAAGGALILGGGRSTNNSAGSRMVSSTVSPSGVHDLTEDEQLAIAMRESMAGRAGPSGAVPSQQGLASTQNASMVSSSSPLQCTPRTQENFHFLCCNDSLHDTRYDCPAPRRDLHWGLTGLSTLLCWFSSRFLAFVLACIVVNAWCNSNRQ